jgi:hypothetical protein
MYYKKGGGKCSKYDDIVGVGNLGESKFSGFFTCGSKDHRKADCDKGGQKKKVTKWNGDVNMLTLVRDPFKESSINSIDEG